MASATKPELFLRNTQQKNDAICASAPPSPSSPASQRRSSHSSRSSHTQLSQQSLCNAGCDFTPALRDIKPSCRGPIVVFRHFTLALHKSPRSVRREGGAALVQVPLTTLLEHPHIGTSHLEGYVWAKIKGQPAKPTQAEHSPHIPGYPQHPQILLFPTPSLSPMLSTSFLRGLQINL